MRTCCVRIPASLATKRKSSCVAGQAQHGIFGGLVAGERAAGDERVNLAADAGLADRAEGGEVGRAGGGGAGVGGAAQDADQPGDADGVGQVAQAGEDGGADVRLVLSGGAAISHALLAAGAAGLAGGEGGAAAGVADATTGNGQPLAEVAGDDARAALTRLGVGFERGDLALVTL